MDVATATQPAPRREGGRHDRPRAEARPSWRERLRRLPPVAFPLAVFAGWRLAHLFLIVVIFGNVTTGPHFRWDGQRYLAILLEGYAEPDVYQPNTAFFPLVSWLGAAVRVVVRNEYAAGMVVSNIAAAAAFVCVWGIVRCWRGEGPARVAVLLMALWPSSFFLWAFYSEALFVAASAGALWAERAGRPRLAALGAATVAMSRVVGVVAVAALVVGRVVRNRRVDGVTALYAAAGLVGLAAVMAVMWWQAGDPVAFLEVQGDWGRALTTPWETVVNGFRVIDTGVDSPARMVTTAKVMDLVAVAAVVLAAGWVAWSARDPERRWPLEAVLLLGALALIPLTSKWLYSYNRFLLDDWVAFAALADMVVLLWARARWVRLVSVPVVAAGLLWGYWFLRLWNFQHFVG